MKKTGRAVKLPESPTVAVVLLLRVLLAFVLPSRIPFAELAEGFGIVYATCSRNAACIEIVTYS